MKVKANLSLELIDRVHRGDRAAYKELCEHVLRIVSFASKIGYEQDFNHHKEDLVSWGCLTVLQLAKSYKDLGPKSSFAGYVYKWLRLKACRQLVVYSVKFSGVASKLNLAKKKRAQFFENYGHMLRTNSINSYDYALEGKETSKWSDCQ